MLRYPLNHLPVGWGLTYQIYIYNYDYTKSNTQIQVCFFQLCLVFGGAGAMDMVSHAYADPGGKTRV